jgi:pheromone shutdown protein TraB
MKWISYIPHLLGGLMGLVATFLWGRKQREAGEEKGRQEGRELQAEAQDAAAEAAEAFLSETDREIESQAKAMRQAIEARETVHLPTGEIGYEEIAEQIRRAAEREK